MLEIKRLNKSFGGLQAIVDFDLSIAENEVVGIIGPNGAGKTTLVNLITGFLRPSSGIIEFEGKDITFAQNDEIARHGIVRTFQLVKPFANLSSLDNVVIGRLYGAEPAQNVKQGRTEAEELLDFVGLGDKKDRIAGNLTFAERRKLELARALAAKPRLLLLDEVVAGLNPVEVEMMLETVKRSHEPEHNDHFCRACHESGHGTVNEGYCAGFWEKNR